MGQRDFKPLQVPSNTGQTLHSHGPFPDSCRDTYLPGPVWFFCPFSFHLGCYYFSFLFSKIQNDEFRMLPAKPILHLPQLVHQLNCTTSGDLECLCYLWSSIFIFCIRKHNGTVVNWKKNWDVCLGIDRVMIMMSNMEI